MTTSATQDHDDDDVSAELTGQGLNKADFHDGVSRRFRITGVDKKTFEGKDGSEEIRRVLNLDPGDKQMTVNSKVNLRLLATWFGPRTRNWIGKEIAVYRDENVMFGSQLVGGWRLRKPSKHDLVNDDDEDVIPF